MTEQEIMALTHDDLVQLCLKRYDEVKSAMRETRIERDRAYRRKYQQKRYAESPEHREKKKEKIKEWIDKNKEREVEYARRYRERHIERIREYQREYHRKRRLKLKAAALGIEAEPKQTVAQEEPKPHIIVTPEMLGIAKTVKAARKDTAPAQVFGPEEPRRRTDRESVEYWEGRIAELDRRYDNSEIGLEEWCRETSIAVRHRDNAERMAKMWKPNGNRGSQKEFEI